MPRNPIVFMFSGQGSQYYHMGEELYLQNPIFRRWMSDLNQYVYQCTGLSVIDELYNETKGRTEPLEKLQYSHPAIFMVEYSLTRMFIESGIEPDLVLGASLGEFTAAAVSGIISAEKVLECILKQVELYPKFCRPGSMIAVIDNPDIYFQSLILSQNSELAAVNFATHFIISGDLHPLQQIAQFLKTGGILYQTLPVQYGFHSANIDPIQVEYCTFLKNFQLNKPNIPMISSVSGKRILEIAPEYFWDVIRQPISFQKAIKSQEIRGNYTYIDLGPSGTLANFTKQNLSQDSSSRYYSIITPFHQDLKNFNRTMAELSL